jgi:hypothetical protein
VQIKYLILLELKMCTCGGVMGRNN